METRHDSHGTLATMAFLPRKPDIMPVQGPMHIEFTPAAPATHLGLIGRAGMSDNNNIRDTAPTGVTNRAGGNVSAGIPCKNNLQSSDPDLPEALNDDSKLPCPPSEALVDLVQSSDKWFFPNPYYGIPMPTCTSATGQHAVDYVRLILTAQVYDVATETPLQVAPNLSARLGNTLLLKREDLQAVFSFKLRGAYNRMCQLSETERVKGVIASSAGNHAQGVALAARKLGIHATIVMPTMTPPIKWKNVRRLGATVLLHGADFDEAKHECARLAAEHGYINIPPYDDPYVIAGQGTVGVEIIRQLSKPRELDAIFVCIGGGGLAAGIVSYVKRLYPSIKVYGVETYDAAAMTYSLLAGKRVSLPRVGLFADGAAVRVVGEETFNVCRELLDGVILVTTDEICAAIKDIFEETRSVVEPAGALSVAGCKKFAQRTGIVGERWVSIVSGANMNFDRLRFVAERAVFGEGREVLLTVIIPERPGAFADLYSVIHPRTVSEFAYRYGDPNEAHIFIGFQTATPENISPEQAAERVLTTSGTSVAPSIHPTVTDDVANIISMLSSKGMRAFDASSNDMAKDHARHLVGGRNTVPNERVFRFSFPERPGALLHFLSCMSGPCWNVSLFHHRNRGGDVSRVLCGIQVPPETEAEFEGFLGNVGFPYVEETGNPIYQYFLR